MFQLSQQNNSIIPIISIIGKPNVGKSSLFNRLIRQNRAIVSNQAGTTRDRIFERIFINDLHTILVDTGGIEFEDKENIEQEVQTQARLSIKEADLILLILEYGKEITKADNEIINLLRKQSKPIILILSKADKPLHLSDYANYSTLGFKEIIPISTIHNLGIQELQQSISKHLKLLNFTKPIIESENQSSTCKITFIGRPNVGKSSLINAIIGKQQLIVSEIPGTTRDSIDLEFYFKENHYTLIDTAGIRRRGKIEHGIEKYSVIRTLNSIERSDICCLVLDFSLGVRAQDLHVANYILEATKGLIIIVNKTDLMENPELEKRRFFNLIKYRFDFLPWAPLIFTSAKTKTHLDQIFSLAKQIFIERKKIIPQIELDSWLRETITTHQPPFHGQKKFKFTKIIHTSQNPPVFDIYVNNPEKLHFTYKRYLENKFREKFGFIGTTIRLYFSPPSKRLRKINKNL